MTWAAPVTTWPSHGGVSTTDMNRIEGNILHRQRIFGLIGGASGYAITAVPVLMGGPLVTVPVGHSVYLHSVAWCFDDVDTRIYVSSFSPTIKFDTTASSGRSDTTMILYTNDTAATIFSGVSIYVYSVDTTGAVARFDSVQIAYSVGV